ncbi:MAG: bifunctional proline dehydrogenase/L-glutamate gamma-semialdehyde dehydrogenase PutA, partial [Dongiaceae bacterium]
MIFREPLPSPDPLRARIRALHRADETRCVEALIELATLSPETLDRIAERARAFVREVREKRLGNGGIDAFMHEYALSSREGVVLMCLAEALLRVPDADTADRLIRDKLEDVDWRRHVGSSESLFVNASTWALMLTGRIMRLDRDDSGDLGAILGRLLSRSGEPVIRQAVTQAMRILGRQFVMGRTIDEALDRARRLEAKGFRYSYDMLGEAARTMRDADRYMVAYENAIASIGAASSGLGPIDSPGISVKLSALHPRYEFAQRHRAMSELVPRLLALTKQAKNANIGFTVDAEEADRLDLSLDVIEAVAVDPSLAGWDGFGLAMQAYQKRAPALIDWLADLSRRSKRRLMVRLVKGAYWDTEIKLAQERGLEGYPVYTRKVSTDVSFIACAKKLLAEPDAFYPQFATHNAHTLATVLELAGNRHDFEFQRLHGMGDALYEEVAPPERLGCAVRIYAPVGSHEDLLAYLVRRLLENGANTSFANRIVDESAPIDEIIADPIARVRSLPSIPHPGIPLPIDLFQPERTNSKGIDLTDPAMLVPLAASMPEGPWQAAPIVGGRAREGKTRLGLDPADTRRVIGQVVEGIVADVEDALARAHRAWVDWEAMPAGHRADCLDRIADLYEVHRAELMAIAIREGGKTLADALAEVREAVDFCRYYASRARADF